MVRRGRVDRSKWRAGRTTLSGAGVAVFPESDGAGEDAATLAITPCFRFLLRAVAAEGGVATTATVGGDGS